MKNPTPNATTTATTFSRSSCRLLLEQLSRTVGLQAKPSEIQFPKDDDDDDDDHGNNNDHDQSASSSSSSPPPNTNEQRCASVLVLLLLVERPLHPTPPQPPPPSSSSSPSQQETTVTTPTTTTPTTTTTTGSGREEEEEEEQDPDTNDTSCCWHVVLTQRSNDLSSYAGQVCLPGGRQDEEDQGDDIVTALRETTEEIGIPSTHITPLCVLPPVPFLRGVSVVTPVVGLWNWWTSSVSDDAMAVAVEESHVHAFLHDHLTLSPDEVQTVFTVPLDYFWDHNGNVQSLVEVPFRGRFVPVRTYEYNNTHDKDDQNDRPPFQIWGLTAHILRRVANLVYHSYPNTTTTTTTTEERDHNRSCDNDDDDDDEDTARWRLSLVPDELNE
ncbi:hypothetical protein ACA910_001292 [Epithemia clementina (nom. ined.)]